MDMAALTIPCESVYLFIVNLKTPSDYDMIY